MSLLTFDKKKIVKEGGVVILTIDEYEKLKERAIPTYYLKGGVALKLDTLVEKSLNEYRRGKTKIIRSLKDLKK